MRPFRSIFLFLVLSAATAQVLAATQQSKRFFKHKLQQASNSAASDQEQQPLVSTNDLQSPARTTGTARPQKEIRVKVRRQRRHRRRAGKARKKDLDGGVSTEGTDISTEREVHRPSGSERTAINSASAEKAADEAPQDSDNLSGGQKQISDAQGTQEDSNSVDQAESTSSNVQSAKKRPRSTRRGSKLARRAGKGRGRGAPAAKHAANDDKDDSASETLAGSESLQQEPAAAAVNTEAAKQEPEARRARSGADSNSQNARRARSDGKRRTAKPLPHDGDPAEGYTDRGDPGEGDQGDPGQGDPGREEAFLPLDAPEQVVPPDESSQPKTLFGEGSAADPQQKDAQQPASEAGRGEGESNEAARPDGGSSGETIEAGKGERAKEGSGVWEPKQKLVSGESESAGAAVISAQSNDLREALDKLRGEEVGDGVWVLSSEDGITDAAAKEQPEEAGSAAGFADKEAGGKAQSQSRNASSAKAKAQPEEAGAKEEDNAKDPDATKKVAKPEGISLQEPVAFKQLMDHFKIASFLDVPCGNAIEVSSKVDEFPTDHPNDIRYYGVDDSEEAINSAVRVHGKTPKWSFHLQDYVRGDLPQADLLGSRAALLRPDMLSMVDLLANFARSGASLALLGSFEDTALGPAAELDMTNGSNDTSMTNGARDGSDAFFLSLRDAPFELNEPLQVFPMPKGFSGKPADDSKDAESGAPAKQMLLFSGDYLRGQDYDNMRERAKQWLSQN